MPSDRDVRLSKLLAFGLRHDPGAFGISLDDAGFAEVEAILLALSANGEAVTREELVRIVETNAKQRFAFDDERRLLRAVQGHSVEVDLRLAPIEPPPELYHGTVARFLEAIRREGLVHGERQHVHLSSDEATARRVAARRGEPVVLVVDARRLAERGQEFFRAENGVWLTAHVPPDALRFP